MTPLDPDELQEGMQLLREALAKGTLHVAPHLADEFKAGLGKVRVDSSGRVDPATVDSHIAMTARMLLWRHHREELKKAAPLEDIQEAYFALVHGAFAEVEELRRENGASASQVAHALAKQSYGLEENHRIVQAFVEEIRGFWDEVSDPTWIHTEEERALRAVFTGEIFPSEDQNAASLYGFYVDTVVLPDPFLKITPLLPFWDRQKQVYEVTRLALQVLQYRELALAPVSPPIVMILPDRFGLTEEYRHFITEVAEPDAVQHASKLFGQSFANGDEVVEYVTRFKSPAEVAAAIARPELLLFDAEWTGTPADQIASFHDSGFTPPEAVTSGLLVWSQIVGRMGQATDALRRSADAGGVPVMHAATSWRWLNWKLEYGSDAYAAGDDHMHIIRALQQASEREFQWLGNIPPAALVEMRAEGAIDEIRAILSDGVAEIARAAPNNFVSTTHHVIGNLRIAFAEHQRGIGALEQKKWKFAGRDLSTFLVAGSIEVAAAASGNPLFGVGAALASLSGLTPTAREIYHRIVERKVERDQIARSPVGLLFKRR